MNCIFCKTKFKARRSDARFCSQKCRTNFARAGVTDTASKEASSTPYKKKKVSQIKSFDDMTLDEYMGSEQYAKDIQGFIREHPGKTTFGGVTKNGTTYYKTPNGEVISIPVSTK